MDIFSFSSYEDVFTEMLGRHAEDRGYKTKLAKAINTHPSYITKICKGTAYLTPDQAAALGEFWNLRSFEKDYFLWLVLKGRASNKELRKIAEENLATLKATHDELGKSLSAEQVHPITENQYYFNWLYSAVHLFATLKTPPLPEQMALRLGVPIDAIHAALKLLQELQLVEWKSGHRPKATQKNIHLSNQSWMAPLQHRNWRIASAERIGRLEAKDLRYTGIHSLSKSDVERLRGMIREFLVGIDKTVRISNEETVAVLTMDFYEL